MSVQRYEGAPPPAPNQYVTYQVLRPQKHGPLDLTILSDTIRGVITHWVTSDNSGVGTSLVCHQYEGYCPYHDDRLEWSGWLPCYDHAQRKRVVLRLAPKEADALSKCLGVDLRWAGLRVRITPTNAGDGRRITVERHNEAVPPLVMGAHEIERTICLVLKCPRIPRQAPLQDDPSDVPYPPPGNGGAS